MNAPHWHLVLNHLPVVGMLFGTGLLAYALWRQSEELIRTTFGFLVVVALTAVPVYLTGEPAEMAIMDMDGYQDALVNAHDRAATVALVSVLIVGALALGGLIFYRKTPALPRWLKGLVFALALAVTGWLGWTANLGGKIHHPEIRSEPAAGANG